MQIYGTVVLDAECVAHAHQSSMSRSPGLIKCFQQALDVKQPVLESAA